MDGQKVSDFAVLYLDKTCIAQHYSKTKDTCYAELIEKHPEFADCQWIEMARRFLDLLETSGSCVTLPSISMATAVEKLEDKEVLSDVLAALAFDLVIGVFDKDPATEADAKEADIANGFEDTYYFVLSA